MHDAGGRVACARRLALPMTLALAACSLEDPGPAAAGGSAGSAGTSASAGGGQAASGATSGGTAGTVGLGGAGNPATPGSGGVTAGTGGTTAGTGGTTAGTGGAAPTGNDFVTGVNIEVHPEVNTILVVTWTQTMAAEETQLEFSFEAGNVMRSKPKPGAAGEHRDVVLGVPGETPVTVRIISKQAGMEYATQDYQGTTDAVPSGMPEVEVLAYDPNLASPDRWLFGAVEDSDGACNNNSCYYHTTFWLYIMDRQGRVVWYYADPASNATSSFQRIARDGEYIWIEKRPFGGGSQRGVLKMTLDWEYFEEIPVPNLADCIDVTDDGSLLYDTTGQNGQLREMTRAGQVRDIWSCRAHFGQGFACYSNTVNWNPLNDTVLMSFPEERTVVEIDRESGALVGQYGEASGSYDFSPSSWGFGFQHFPNITADGTLILSSHMPGYEETRNPVAGQHAFMEFTIDRQNQTLIEKWIYNDGPEWAMYKGMAIRLPNGNTLGNYGTGGVIREITPDKQTAFHVKFDVEGGNDFFNKMVGHNVLINDLYALNGGGPQ
jgi:hypothetical protein